MNLQYRVDLMVRLGEYILSNSAEWQEVKDRASRQNGWFTPEFIDLSCNSIAIQFLNKNKLEAWIASYSLPTEPPQPRTVGLVMAGNIPLVGFHDFLCVFISGHRMLIKASSKDDVLIKHLVQQLEQWEPAVSHIAVFSDMLKNCDAYIATGSNNSAGYFDYYFSKYPHIIRRNRTSVAILTGHESTAQLDALADDVFLYFGLGCRNVTKLYVPKEYDFVPLIRSFDKYASLADNHKYKNNYDYNLALHLLNKKYYMSNPSLLLVEEESLFSPISQLNYEFYDDKDKMTALLKDHQDLQCIVGEGFIPFGQSQSPQLQDYADGVDTLKFLNQL